MEATELRIENIVYNRHGEFQVITHNSFQAFRHPTMDGNPSGFKPVPLTEEILLKVSPISKQEGYPYKFLKGYLKMRNGVFFYKYYGIEVELPYLHQLQNLYFALIGEELKVEL